MTPVRKPAGKQAGMTGHIKVGTQYWQARALMAQGPANQPQVSTAYLVDATLYNAQLASTFTLTASGQLTTPSKETKAVTGPMQIPPNEALIANVPIDDDQQPVLSFNSAAQIGGKGYTGEATFQALDCSAAQNGALSCSVAKQAVKFAVCEEAFSPNAFVLVAADAKVSPECKIYEPIFEKI